MADTGINTCIEWRGAIGKGGYGNVKKYGRYWNAHRLAWIEKYGEIKKGLNVCHRCDNKKCVNIDHLFLASQLENVRDCWRKKRNILKIPYETIEAIRDEYRDKRTPYSELVKKYEVSKSHVNRIIHGMSRMWA